MAIPWSTIGSYAAAAAPVVLSAVPSIMGLFGKSDSSNSALQSFLYSKALQEHQYELNRKTRQTAFQDTRQSLEEANYNPLLAVGQQAQGGTFGASMSVTDPKTENLQNGLARLSYLSQAQLNSSQASLNKKNAFATVINALNNTNQTNAQVGLINSQAQGQQIQNMIQNAYGMQSAQATLNNIKANTTNTQAQTILNRAQTKVAQATANMVTNQAQQIGYQNSALQANAQWHKQHPYWSQVSQWNSNVIAPIFGSAGTVVNSAATASNARTAAKVAGLKIK